jgi:predicted O-methyltransferase YrrM
LIKNLKPECILELGTCVGISTSYQALAMKGNQKGVIYTLEGAPEIAKVAVETVTILGLAELTEIIVGPFHTTLPILLEKIKPIDIFFNDGHHSYDAVLQYFEQVYPYLADQAVMIIDDISWSDGMQKAWQELVSDSRITVSVNLCSLGIVLISKEQSKKEKYNLQITK